MKPLTVLCLIGLSCLSYGCVAQAQQKQSPPEQQIPSVMTGSESQAQSRRLTLKLTLSNPDDLKVREGDKVKEGQILSDRTRDRQRLEAQKQQLQIQIGRLQQPIAGPPPQQGIPEVAGLPPASFVDEVAEVERQRVIIQQAEAAVMNQQRMIDLLQSMPDEQLPEATIPHESEVLAQKQRELDQAQAELQVVEAKLAQAQQDRQYQEYLHSLEMSKRAISIQQQQLQRQEQLQQQQAEERDRSFQLAEMDARMQQLDMQIITLSAVRSPYSGRIQRVSWEGQNDQNLVVELTLIADAPDASPGTVPNSGGSNTGGDNGATDRGTD